MFSRFKPGSSIQALLEGNAITSYYEVGRQTATAGPGLLWRVHDAYRKSDGKEASVFVFDKRTAEKLHKPRRKETISEMLRHGVRQLERCRHPRLLRVLHSVEETADTLAFATESVAASLCNVLSAAEEKARESEHDNTTNIAFESQTNTNTELPFLDVEIKYGILQLTEALSFLHMTAHLIHRNVCPASVLITRRGTWKLAGLEFAERVNEHDGFEPLTVQRWTSKIAKMAQPDLDFIAPEVQIHCTINCGSDMFSLGLVIAAIFNKGRPLIQAGHSNPNYTKQIDTLNDQVRNVLPSIPVGLQEALVRLLSRDSRKRPNAQLLSSIKYFSDPVVHALQFLDVINMKDPAQKAQFYRCNLKEVLPAIPKKLWFQHVWPNLQQELRTQEVLAAALQPVLLMIQEISSEDYQSYIMPSIRQIMAVPKSIQANVTLLENLHIIVRKTPQEDLDGEILPMLYSAFESSTLQVQSAALVSVTNIADSLEDQLIRKMVLPKMKSVFERNSSDLKLTLNVLACLDRITDRLDRSAVIDDVLPLLWDVKLQDPEIIEQIVSIYKRMLSNKKHGLSVSLMATRVMPSLLPQTMNPSLSLDQFSSLLELLQEMLEHIDRHQRNKLKLDNLSLPSPERMRALRHQHSTDNMHVPNLSVPFVKVDQRKTCSEENMMKSHSHSSSPGSPDSNYLRVAQTLTGRRLSDNVLGMNNSNNASGNGGMRNRPPVSGTHLSPSSCLSVGTLPTRRHSSIGSTDRRASNACLLTPTSAGMTSASTSVPALQNLSGSPGGSAYGSRRGSVCPPTLITGSGSASSSSGSSILQQIGSGVYQLLTGK